MGGGAAIRNHVTVLVKERTYEAKKTLSDGEKIVGAASKGKAKAL